MNLDPAPRVSKTVFLLIDAGLLVTAFIIAYLVKDPFAPLPFVLTVLCVALAGIIGLIPFLLDYAADSAEYVQAERAKVADHVQRLNAASESLARAAAQIKAVEEAVHKTAHAAENLPYRMQEKLAEFNEALAAKEDSDREALETELEQLRTANGEQLKATAEKISKAAADWTALEVATRKQLTATEAAIAKLQTSVADTAAKAEAASASATSAATKLDSHVAAALRDLDARLDALKLAVAAIPATAAVAAVAAPAPVPVVSEPTAPSEASAPTEAAASAPASESVAPTAEPALELAPAAEPPKPKKPRAPRKPKAEDTLAALSESATTDSPAPAEAALAESAPAAEITIAPTTTESTPPPAPEPEPEPAPAPAALAATSDDSSGESAAEPASASGVESSTSSDGATRLLATAYIGIGNKLFIRGDGPGLSWDHGVPMQFVSIGKWGWFTHDAAGPVRCKLYKNDETAALTGEIILEAGRHTEVTALF